MKKHFRNIFSLLLAKWIILSGMLTARVKYILRHNIPLALYFHNPDKELFENIIVWFKKNGFRFLSLQDFLFNLQNNVKIKGAIWLSFDDGYQENMTNVLPVLKQYQVPATFFISTKSVEEGYFWWDIISKNSSKQAYNLWKISNRERVEIISKVKREKPFIPRRAIKLESLKELSLEPLVDIANHTDDHVICNNCCDEELIREIKLCEEKLINWVGSKYVNVFSYPNGDFNDSVKSVVKNNNMVAAFTNDPKLITDKSDMYLIPRIGVADNVSFAENLLHAVGIWQPIITKLKKALR
jgi:peptidoglycan/xylan/chitin deacetylase (PgdA/CDA1 family)